MGEWTSKLLLAIVRQQHRDGRFWEVLGRRGEAICVPLLQLRLQLQQQILLLLDVQTTRLLDYLTTRLLENDYYFYYYCYYYYYYCY